MKPSRALTGYVDDLFGGPAAALPLPPAFFNTNKLTEAALATAKAEAKQQQDRVLAIFSTRPGEALGPSAAWKLGGESTWLLTSVRRAITVLTGLGLLVKLPDTVPGHYGKPEHQWRLATDQEKAAHAHPAA